MFINANSYNQLVAEYIETKSLADKNNDYIIYMCDGKIEHGGLTDRIQGILTTYYISKKLRRPFKIFWSSPFELSKYLECNNYDWKIDAKDVQYIRNKFNPIVFFLFPNKYLLRNILGFVIYCYWIYKQKNECLIYTNYKYPKKKFNKLYNELFIPTKLVQKEINRHLQLIGNKYWSVSFRFLRLLNDFQDGAGQELNSSQIEDLINKNIVELKKVLKNLPKGYRCLITSDSISFINKVKLIDPRIYTVNGNISHLDFINNKNIDEESNEDPWLKLFIDHNLIMNAERVYLFRTDNMYKSNFSKYAALIGNKDFFYHEF